MVAKVFGLATGAFVASLAVWGFNSWRTVTDRDLLADVIADHCVPFVTTGQTPFEGMGRPVGVYDAAELRDRITDGGNAILFDNRFVAQWGQSTDSNSAVRVCFVDYSYERADGLGFELDTTDLIDWTTDLLGAGLAYQSGEIVEAPNLLIWEDPDAGNFEGLRVLLTAQTGGVVGVLVVNDLDD